MLIGYARVSTIEQNFDLQTDALAKAGCTRIFIDKASGLRLTAQVLKKCCRLHVREENLVGVRLH